MKTNEVNYPTDAPTDANKQLIDYIFGDARLYRHKPTGGIYEAIVVSIDHATGVEMQVYQSVETNIVHSRPLSEFVQKFEKI